MSTISYEELAKATGGEMCGGDLIARIDGKHVVLGRKRGLVFNLTAEGEEVAANLVAAPAKPAKAEKPAKAAKAEAKGQDIKVDLTSETSLEDMLG